VNREAASVLADLVDAVAGLGPRLHLHQRLARAWKLNERDAQCLRRALVLAAWPQDDAAMHAARAAAAGAASLSACALAGLAAFQGARLGGGLAQMQVRLAEARRAGAEALFAPGGPALFSTGTDVRAQALLAGVDLSADVRRLVEAAAGRDRSPSFEFALVLTARDLDLPREAPFIVAAVGQATNWLAAGVDAHAALSPDGPGAG
jgi:citrate synthase